jgi:hypothetical protein
MGAKQFWLVLTQQPLGGGHQRWLHVYLQSLVVVPADLSDADLGAGCSHSHPYALGIQGEQE